MGSSLLPFRSSLETPVAGLEAEFNVYLDGEHVVPEEVWRDPSGFIRAPLLRRTSRSSQLPTGGAVYFDRGVIEVVTPVIELGPSCTARVVRSLWEQIEFVHAELRHWGEAHGRSVRLGAFSAHYNVSFELRRDERSPQRTIQKLGLLLAHLLPVPVIVVGANRRSTGVGVRPRRDRIEVTLDFTPDPGLMIATAAIIVGIVRDVMCWPSYMLRLLDRIPVAVAADVQPGRHTTRKGWLTRDFHFPQSPFTSDPDERIWKTQTGEIMSLREMALETAWFFRRSIREHADPFTFRLLFAVLEGRLPSLLDLPDRPAAYDDIISSVRWGQVLPDLNDYRSRDGADALAVPPALARHVAARAEARTRHAAGEVEPGDGKKQLSGDEQDFLDAELQDRLSDDSDDKMVEETFAPSRRRTDRRGGVSSPWSESEADRRRDAASATSGERRSGERRALRSQSYPDARLPRSPYERVFRTLASRKPIRIGGELLEPVAMKGWYHAVMHTGAGEERLVSIDDILQVLGDEGEPGSADE